MASPSRALVSRTTSITSIEEVLQYEKISRLKENRSWKKRVPNPNDNNAYFLFLS